MTDYSEYSFIFDVDGTLCPIKKPEENYADLVPYEDMISKIREYKEKGARIVLFTSRTMRTYKGDIDLILKNTAPVLEAWLKKWDIPYDEIIYGKPWPGKKGFYVDDRTIRPEEFINCDIEKMEKICESGRNKRLIQ